MSTNRKVGETHTNIARHFTQPTLHSVLDAESEIQTVQVCISSLGYQHPSMAQGRKNHKKKNNRRGPVSPSANVISVDGIVAELEHGGGKQACKKISSNIDSRNANFYRLEGNAAVARQDYKRALVSYKVGIQLLSNDDDDHIRCALHSNLALTYLKLQNYALAIEECNTVLREATLHASNAKIWLRRACARELLCRSELERIRPHLQVHKQMLKDASEDVLVALRLLCENSEDGLTERQESIKVLSRECYALQKRIQQLQELVNQDLDTNHLQKQPVNFDTDNNNNLPPPQYQNEIVIRLLSARGSKKHVGEAFFLVDWLWYCHWCHYTRSDLSKWLPGGTSPSIDKTLLGYDSQFHTKTRTMAIVPPGPIDNSGLLLLANSRLSSLKDTFTEHWYKAFFVVNDEEQESGCSNVDLHKKTPLRPNLQRGYHYEIVPREVYALLRLWYGEVSSTSDKHLASGICRRSECRKQYRIFLPLYPAMATGAYAGRLLGSECNACRAHLIACRRCTRCMNACYCSKRCQAAHWEFHRYECSPASDWKPVTSSSLKPDSHSHPGLKNLGNTCYMNATLQCLLHVAPLIRYFLSGQFKDDLNVSNTLGTGGDLAMSFSRFVREMLMNPKHFRSSSSCFSPLGLKRSISKYAPRFVGYQQHDAQEFLAYLLDGLHEDLNRVTKPPYVEMPDFIEGDDMGVAGALAWELHKRRHNSLVYDCFYGQFRSTCVCPKCSHVSVSFDTFNQVSLEIPGEMKRPVLFSLFFRRQAPHVLNASLPERFGFKLFLSQRVSDLKEKLAGVLEIPVSSLILCEIVDSRIYEVCDDEKSLGLVHNDAILFAYDISSLKSEGCFHLVAEHLLLTHTMNGPGQRRRNNFGFPLITSFPADFTCRQAWAFLWGQVAALVSESERGVLRLRAYKSGIQTKIISDFLNRRCSDEGFNHILQRAESKDIKHESFVIPEDSDEPIAAFLQAGEAPGVKLFNVTYEWTERAQSAEPSVPRIDPARFLQFQTNESLLTASTNPMKISSSRYDITLMECFDSFQQAERLDEENMWYCNHCRKHVQALKTIQLWRLPNILVVHIKRFEYRNVLRREKLETFVDFPLEGLDMTDHSALSKTEKFVDDQTPAMYDLIGVVNHYGRLGFGHYTAFARPFNEYSMGHWIHCDDSSVAVVHSPTSIVTSAAYVLFYRRRTFI